MITIIPLDAGLISAAAAVATVLITKVLEFSLGRGKQAGEYRLKKKALDVQEKDVFRNELRGEISDLRLSVTTLRDSNIALQVERARLDLIVEHLKEEITRMDLTISRLETENSFLREKR